jgi:hypothetical protein
MSPDTIPVHNGHAPMVRYSLTYEINNTEKATKAQISVYAPGVGELQKFDVDVQPRAQIEFLLDPSAVDLGPTVRFRAHCPGGDTDWYTMGSQPEEVSQHVSGSQIGNVSPSYIQAASGTSDGGVPVTIWGPQIKPGCTPEAQVDGTTVELKNVAVVSKQITGLLLYGDLQGRPVTTRGLEVNLVVYGSGMPAEDTFTLKYAE